MRKCPMPRCRNTMGDRMLVCTQHWRHLPPNVRDMVRDASIRYLADLISAGEYRTLTSEVLANLMGVAVWQVPNYPLSTTVGRCACGRVVLFPSGGQSLVPVCEDESGNTVIIGSVAVPEAGECPAYTRFVYHWCQPLDPPPGSYNTYPPRSKASEKTGK